MTTTPDEHDQDADPPTPDGEEPEVTHPDAGSSEPGSHPDPEPGEAG